MKDKITIEELRKLLQSKFPEEKVESFINDVKPFYDFYDYMLEKHNMSYEQVEEDSSKFSQDIFNEYLEQMHKSESPIKFMIEISGDIMKRYANKYDYEKSEEVKVALNKYMEFLYLSNLNPNKDGN
ncbi:MAG: hypothetical protein HPY57_15155 [Ignavibacteria bacterium]|nr:hypothetical protein [Ignavibacteria bacterium]